MSSKIKPSLIGLFTLLGLLLAAGSVVMLGAGKYFEDTYRLMLYFDKSVYGLQVGSDVRFGGVRIGRVSSIRVIVDTDVNRKIIPVIVELTEDELRSVKGAGDSSLDLSSFEGIQNAVGEGLRAGMKQESYVTGQLYVEFDMIPQVEGFIYEPKVPAGYPVVPTVSTDIDELISGVTAGLAKINDLDLEGVLTELKNVMAAASKQIAGLDMEEINENLTGITKDLREFTSDEKLKSSLANLDATLEEIRELSEKTNENLDPMFVDIRGVAEDTRKSLASIEKTAEEFSQISDPRSPMLLNFQALLHETETASRALRELTNDLKRNPNSLLRGRERQ